LLAVAFLSVGSIVLRCLIFSEMIQIDVGSGPVAMRATSTISNCLWEVAMSITVTGEGLLTAGDIIALDE
jgi:hypothetical protein